MTGAISFSGVSLEAARAERRVFLRTLAILLGVDESWVRVAIRRARRSRRRLYTPIYVPSTAPTRKMLPAPSLTPTSPAALEPTGVTTLEPTAADGVSIDYNVSVPSISEAEAVEAVVETTTPEDVDVAVETCVESKFCGAFVLNRRVVLHAIDATPARWRGGVGSSPLDRACTRRNG